MEENQDHIPSQVDEGIEGSKDNLQMSTRLEVEFAFNLERTSENPLRGFYTNYDWGEPVNDFRQPRICIYTTFEFNVGPFQFYL